MGFSRQEYWSGLLWPPPGDLPNPEIKPRFPALQVDSLPSEPRGKPWKLKTIRSSYIQISDNIFSTKMYTPFPTSTLQLKRVPFYPSDLSTSLQLRMPGCFHLAAKWQLPGAGLSSLEAHCFQTLRRTAGQCSFHNTHSVQSLRNINIGLSSVKPQKTNG